MIELKILARKTEVAALVEGEKKEPVLEVLGKMSELMADKRGGRDTGMNRHG